MCQILLLQHQITTLPVFLLKTTSKQLLRIRVLENHVFLYPKIERPIAAHDVLNQRVETVRLF
jgi:hypothetical protein